MNILETIPVLSTLAAANIAALDVSMKDRIVNLEKEMLKLPQVQIPVKHYFANGLYAREVRIPAGAAITGAVMLDSYLDICVSGTVSVMEPTGEYKEVTGPAIMIRQPGMKRAGYTHTDTVWITCHATNATTVEEAEAAIAVADYEGTPYVNQQTRLLES
jgi:hypothetical protein